MGKTKKIAIAIIAILAFGLIAYGIFALLDSDKESIFVENKTEFVLSEDYKLSDIDVTATGGTDKVVKLTSACSFDLGDKTLDLNGYTLKIVSSEQDCVVTFESGTIKNGTLSISVPNGDIEFVDAKITENVKYDLESASSTIVFNKTECLGDGTIKSDSRVTVENSSLKTISFDGSGKLEAGIGAILSMINIGKNATGASVEISELASVSSVNISAKSTVNIAGAVVSVKISEGATESSEIKVNVSNTARVEAVEINAPSKFEVSGQIGKMTVNESANSGEVKTEVKVAPTATVEQVSIKAKADVEVKGSIGNITIAGTASGTNVAVKGDAIASRIVVDAENTTVSGNSSNISQVIVSTNVVDKVTTSSGINKEVVDNIQDVIKDHEYLVVEKQDSTCDSAGYIIYKCSHSDCQDGFTVNVSPKGHTFESEVTKLPSHLSVGIRTFTCTVCEYSYEQAIDALEFESQTISSLIGAIIQEGNYSVSFKDGTIFHVYEKCDGVVNELTSVTPIKLKVLDSSLIVANGVPKGIIKVSFSIVDEEYIFEQSSYIDEEIQLIVNIYVDGDNLYGEFMGYVVGDETNVQNYYTTMPINSIFNGIMDEICTAEQLLEMIDDVKVLEQLTYKFQPFVEKITEEIKYLDYNFEDLFSDVDFEQIVNDYLINAEEVEGDTLYEVNLQGLRELVLRLKTDTPYDVIEAEGGEGSYDNLITEVKKLPELTVKEIADRAIALEEAYGLDVEFTLKLIDKLLYKSTGVEINLKQEIESRYDYTVLDVVYELYSENVQDPITKDAVKSAVSATISEIEDKGKTLTLDKIYNLICFGDTEYEIVVEVVDGEPVYGPFALSDSLNKLILNFEQVTELNVLVGDDGLKTLIFNYQGIEFEYDFTSNIYEVNVSANGVELVGTYNPETKILDAELTMGETVYELSVEIEGEDSLVNALVMMNEQEMAQLTVIEGLDEGEYLLNANLFGVLVNGSYDSVSKSFNTEITVGENVYELSVEMQGEENLMNAVISIDDQAIAQAIIVEGAEEGEYLLDANVLGVVISSSYNEQTEILQGEFSFGEDVTEPSGKFMLNVKNRIFEVFLTETVYDEYDLPNVLSHKIYVQHDQSSDSYSIIASMKIDGYECGVNREIIEVEVSGILNLSDKIFDGKVLAKDYDNDTGEYIGSLEIYGLNFELNEEDEYFNVELSDYNMGGTFIKLELHHDLESEDYSANVIFGGIAVSGTVSPEDKTFDGELSLGETVYAVNFEYNEDDNVTSAFIKVADQILADFVIDVDKTDDNTIINADASLMEYDVEAYADKNEGTANVVIKAEDNEIAKVVISTDENGEIKLTITYLEGEILEFKFNGEEDDFQTEFELILNEHETLIYNLSFVNENDTSKLIMDLSGIIDESTTNTIHCEFDFTALEEENRKGLTVDIIATVNYLFDKEETTVFEGSIGYEVSLDEEGKTETVNVKLKFDVVYKVYMIYVDENGEESRIQNENAVSSKKVFTMIGVDVEFDINLIEDKVGDISGEIEEIKNKLEIAPNVEFDLGDKTFIYVKTDTEEYFKITETRIGFSDDYFLDTLKKIEMTYIIPVKDGIPVNAVIDMSKNQSGEISIHIYDYFSRITADCTETIITGEIEFVNGEYVVNKTYGERIYEYVQILDTCSLSAEYNQDTKYLYNKEVA